MGVLNSGNTHWILKDHLKILSMKSRIVFRVMALWFLFVVFNINEGNSQPGNLPKELGERFRFIPGGMVITTSDTFSVGDCYFSKQEVSNWEYLEFLQSLQREGKPELYARFRVDSVAWSGLLKANEAYLVLHRQAFGAHLPVVNIPQEAARAYCTWLEARLNRLADGKWKVKLGLPTRAEWIRAARGDHFRAPYSWDGPFLKRPDGLFLAEFNRIGSEAIHRKDDGSFEVITADSFLETEGIHRKGNEHGPMFPLSPAGMYGFFGLGLPI